MEIEITSYIEDIDILQSVSEREQSEVLENIFYECTDESQQRFISGLDDSYLVEELERRGYTIKKNKKMKIAEILKDYPSGTVLYCPIYGELSLLGVQLGQTYPICCRVIRSGSFMDFTEDGKICTTDAEPTLFPSRDQRDWNKFGMTNQESKHQLNPFDKVLVRDYDSDKWVCDIFSHIDDCDLYYCVGTRWNQCIPYEGNENLLGTTNNP